MDLLESGILDLSRQKLVRFVADLDRFGAVATSNDNRTEFFLHSATFDSPTCFKSSLDDNTEDDSVSTVVDLRSITVPHR